MNESDIIKNLFDAIPPRTRAEFCRKHSLKGGVSMVYQHCKGIKPVSLEAAVGYALAFGKPLAEISPRLAAIIDRLPKPYSPPAIQAVPVMAERQPVLYGALESELQCHVEKMDQRGLVILIDKAEEIAARHPKEKGKKAA